MTANPFSARLRILAALALAALAPRAPAWAASAEGTAPGAQAPAPGAHVPAPSARAPAQSSPKGPGADRREDIEMAVDQYGEKITPAQRSAIIDYLHHLNSEVAASVVVDHVLAARDGIEATRYGFLVEALKPDGCTAVLERLAVVTDPTGKGKLIVALRHCEGDRPLAPLEGCLSDARPVPFEAHGPHPRRVCDLAYDEIYLKVRANPRYKLDAGPRMRGFITEKMPIKKRDALIAKLKAALPGAIPSQSPSPSRAAAAA